MCVILSIRMYVLSKEQAQLKRMASWYKSYKSGGQKVAKTKSNNKKNINKKKIKNNSILYEKDTVSRNKHY